MDKFGTYFSEAFLHRLLPLFEEIELGALSNFQPESYPLAAGMAAIGALAASLLLFGLGVWLRRWPERISTEAQQARIETARGVAREWLPWLLVLAPMPVGGIFIIAAGFFRLHWGLTAGMIVAAEILWRAMPYLH